MPAYKIDPDAVTKALTGAGWLSFDELLTATGLDRHTLRLTASAMFLQQELAVKGADDMVTMRNIDGCEFALRGPETEAWMYN